MKSLAKICDSSPVPKDIPVSSLSFHFYILVSYLVAAMICHKKRKWMLFFFFLCFYSPAQASTKPTAFKDARSARKSAMKCGVSCAHSRAMRALAAHAAPVLPVTPAEISIKTAVFTSEASTPAIVENAVVLVISNGGWSR